MNGRVSPLERFDSKGPTWKVQTMKCLVSVSGPTHVAVQMKPQPYSKVPWATTLPVGFTIL